MNLEGKFYHGYHSDSDIKDYDYCYDKVFMLTDKQKEEIITHSNKFNIKEEKETSVWMVFDSLDRFYRLYNSLGYTKEEADIFFSEGIKRGEYLLLESGGIIQFLWRYDS